MESSQPHNQWIIACTLLALFLPLLSFIVSISTPRKYVWVVSIATTFLLLLSAVASCVVSISLFNNHSTASISIDWFKVDSYQFSGGLMVDNLAMIMLPVVTIISFLVHLYSTGYMAGDKNLARYFAMLGFFTFSMLGIVLSDNLLLLFVGWELVGFSSYMLIGHWMEKPEAAAASKKAFLFNRIGDVGFLIGIMLLWTNAGTLNLVALHHTEFYSWQTAASLCLFCGVIGKSAQFPLLTWLPDAMEGPTPVSALIHAATMVAAGVYLVSKLFFLFTPEALSVVACIGAITTLMASLSALTQTDLKKILAYSTISQLGFMIMAVGVGSPSAAMLHLFTHAFFKAGLFLGAGAVIHSMHQLEQQTHHHFDVQDIRNLGGLRKHLPITFITFVVCGAALSGLPLFSGFLSKDAILTSVWIWKGSAFSWKWIIAAIAFLIPLFTTLYTFRLIWYVFFGENKTEKIINQPIQLVEVPVIMRIPLILLSICSAFFLISINPFSYTGWLYSSLHTGTEIHLPFMTIFSSLWVMGSLVFAYFYFRNRSLSSHNSIPNNLFKQSFYLDRIYNQLITLPVYKISLGVEKVDQKVIDGIIHFGAYAQVTFAYMVGWFDKYAIDGTVDGVAWIANSIGSFTRSFQGGKIQLYIFWAVLGIIIFLISMLI